MMPDHICSQIPLIVYAYDQNGNMTSRTVDGVEWTYTYNADGKLTQIRKNNQLVSEYGYDGDGNRVWSKDYEGYTAGEFKETIYIGNYYEFVTEVLAPEPGEGGVCTGTYCTYLPMVIRSPLGISYYYADGQRIAMKDNDGVVSYLYGDQLGSVSAVADTNGNPVSTTLYEPWGEIRNTEGTNPTDYGYTGQMQEGDIYFYNARWPQVREAQRRGFDPSIGRFMQADSIVPIQQGIQAWDKYAYVNNNPLINIDTTGNTCTGPNCYQVKPVPAPSATQEVLNISPATTPAPTVFYPIQQPVPPPFFTEFLLQILLIVYLMVTFHHLMWKGFRMAGYGVNLGDTHQDTQIQETLELCGCQMKAGILVMRANKVIGIDFLNPMRLTINRNSLRTRNGGEVIKEIV